MDNYLKEFKKKHNKCIKKSTKISNYITKVLLSIIFFLISLIIINNKDNKKIYKDIVFNKNLSFTKIKKKYEKYFGSLIPNEKKDLMVFNEDLKYKSIDRFLDGEVLTVDKSALIKSITSGIVIFVGKKDGFENTVIIQGIDGADIWYGNLTNVNVSLYDYVEHDTLIGETQSDKLYLLIKKDNEYIKYEDYQNT